jgi:Xaa-Pro aminopeptidase
MIRDLVLQMVFDLKKARELMRQKNLDCLVATSHDNVYFSSGSDILTITALKRLAAIFIPLDGDPVFAVHPNEEVTARQTTWIKDVRIYEGGEWEPLKPIKFVADVLKEKGLAMFVDAQSIFDKMRAVKTSEELRLLSDANMATAKAITVAFEIAKPGDTERDIAQNMMDYMVEYGADYTSFVTLGAGKNIFETHHMPADYRIKEGDLVHTDFGGFFKGYQSDISRMAVVGKPDDTQLKAYEIAVKAEWATAEAMRAGATVMDVHNAVKRFYESQGYPYTRAFIGHSIGIGCHEYPFLGPSHGDWVLEEGMFFEVEPGQTIGHAKVHTEDAFIVQRSGSKNVSEYRDISNLQVIK